MYYRNELERQMEKFVEAELGDDHEFGYLSENLQRRMADAAWTVLLQNKEVNDYFKEQGMLNPSKGLH